ncbi:MAG: hypothetical protein ACFFDN_08120 [Candidatus Hodarchaeota archaeon]
MIIEYDHNPFEYFLNKCQTYSKKEYETQTKYLENFNDNNLKIRTLDGIFTVKNKKIENLVTD